MFRPGISSGHFVRAFRPSIFRMASMTDYTSVTPVPSPPPEDAALAGAKPAPALRWPLVLLLIFVLLLFYTLYFARDLVMPMLLALVLTLIFTPIVRFLGRFRVPEPLSAAIIVLGLLGGFGLGAYTLSDPLAYWLEQGPRIFPEIERKLHILKEPVKELQKASKEVEKMASVEDEEEAADIPKVVIQEPASNAEIIGGIGLFLTQVVIVVGLLYFLLASGDLFLQKLVQVLPSLSDKKRGVEIVRRIQADVSTYLLTITLINVGLGVCIGVAMYVVGLPNAALWGVMAALLNFAPYVGALVGVGVVTVVSLLTFDTLTPVLAAGLSYLFLTTLEGQFVTPSLLGRRLTMNPVVIFVTVVLWGWLWGAVGLLIAVPLLVTFRVFCEYVEPLSAVGQFLGRRDE
jgi:predicted PurR-regulated permease PerM